MVDLVALRALLAVDETGSVAAAAATTGYTPSAVSQQIKRMERELGVTLLDRVGRGVALTDPARRLVRHGREALRHLELAAAQLDGPDEAPRGTVRIAAFATAVRGLVAPLLADVPARWPDLVPELVEADPADAVALVASGQADLAVVHNWVGIALHRPDHVDGVPLGLDVADLLVHRDHPLAARPVVRPAELLGEAWASTPAGSICHAWFTLMFAGFERLPPVRYWSGEFATHVRLVAAGAAVALVPRLGRGALPPEVVAVPVTDPVPTRQIEVLWRATMAGSAPVRQVTARLRSLAAEPSFARDAAAGADAGQLRQA